MKLICAPMATLSHPAFRILIEKFGFCDEYYNEMINAPSLLNQGPFEEFYINPFPCPEKIVWQLTGRDASKIIDASSVVKKLPGIGVDLNMGCCAPEIYNSGAGIAWMIKDRKETEYLVKGVNSILNDDSFEGDSRRFSVKLRLGDDGFKDEDFFSFCDMLVLNGVKLITLHPRTRKDRYRDKPRYEYAEKLALRYKNQVEVYVNGDVSDVQSFEKVKSLCPDCKGIMIGRAAVQKPWIFAKIHKSLFPEDEVSSLKNVDMKELALDYVEDVKVFQPAEFWKTRLQRFFTYYCNNFSFAHYFQSKMLNCKTPDEAVVQINEYFDKVPTDRFKNL